MMIDTKKLAGAVRGKRGKDSLRKAAKDCGVSYPTLSKIETEFSEPDLENFLKITAWLDVPADYFRAETEPVA